MSDDPTLENLLALEKSYDDLPAGAEARLLARLEATLGGGDGGDGGDDPGGGGPAAPRGGGAGSPGTSAAAPWIARAAYVVAGVVAGASGHALLTSRAPAPAAPVAAATASASSTTTAASAAPPAASAEPEPSVHVAVVDLPDAGTPFARKAAAPAPRTDAGATEERAELDVARAALAHGRVDACLDALDRHARKWGEGRFAEERGALTVQALAAAGRRSEAAARARRFQQKYPTSLFGPAVAQALAE